MPTAALTKMTDTTEPFLIADLFCGAGGTTTGAMKAIAALGRKVTVAAVNHWPVAIETHKLNHPTARHYIQDLDGADPETLVPEGYLDLLMASPECRFFSRARGGKPVNEQGRMSPWVIQRWLTSLDVSAVLVENVPEFKNWSPVGRDGRPVKSRKGLYFQEWVRSLWGLGYEVEWRILNAADYGEATSRTRFFLQARKDGDRIVWPEPTHSRDGDAGQMDGLPRWRGAREIIDWADSGRSLMDDPKYKKKSLSVNTRRRIAKGLQRYGGPLASLYIELLDLPEDDLRPFKEAADHNGLFHGSDRNNTAPRAMDEPIPTVTTLTGGGCYLVQPTVEPLSNGQPATPFVLGQQSGGAPRIVDEPIPTVAADGAIALIQPVVSEYYGNGTTRSVDEPLSAVTTRQRHSLASPVMLKAGRNGAESSASPPVHAYIVPNFGERQGQEPRIHNIDQPMPAATSRGAGSLVSPVVAKADPDTLDGVDPRRIVMLNGEPYLLDIRYRMLQNPELARAMGFEDDESSYEFVGNKSEITKQIGNAVPVRLAAALVSAILAPQGAGIREGEAA